MEESHSQFLCQYLLEKYHVACVPGLAFGDDSAMRLSYATSETILREALTRLTQALADLSS